MLMLYALVHDNNNIHLHSKTNNPMKKLYISLFLACMGIAAFAQDSIIRGKIVEANTNEAVVGAVVRVDGTANGAVTDLDGSFTLTGVSSSNPSITVSSVGYQSLTIPVSLSSGIGDVGTLSLPLESIALEGVNIIASIAIDRKTPVAVSSVSGEVVEEKLGAQELPELLKTTPSVYTTKSGGGAGDARINIRGFDQRNTAYLINGIPVNDMENGWVYWSNWAGLGDVIRTMQVQRGLGASTLAIPSVGGTVNLITKGTDQEKGGNFYASIGNDLYKKYGLTLSTGNINDWALTFSGTRTTGDGYVDGNYIDAYSYFGSISKEIGNHSLSLTAIGAPQKHGQRSFTDRLGGSGSGVSNQYYVETDPRYSSFEDQIRDTPVREVNDHNGVGSIRFNGDLGLLNGQHYNIRENFYHKPQVALNHYWDASDAVFLSTSLYYSTGRGGGTGDRGRINGRGPWGYRDASGQQRIDDIVRWNQGVNNISGFPSQGHHNDPTYGFVATESTGIIKRASMNEHNWIGALSKANIDLNDQLALSGGIDLRKYEGLHYRKVVDLLGNDYWLETRDRNFSAFDIDADGNGSLAFRERNGNLVSTDGKLFGNPGQDQKVNYDNDGKVAWVGGFTELEYSGDKVSGFVSGSISNTGYKRIDRFNYDTSIANDTDPNSATFNPIETDAFNFLGYTAKGGLNYNLTDKHNVFANAGYLSKAPIFGSVFPFFNNVNTNADAANENILGLEAGYGFRSRAFSANVNAYRTSWRDKSFTRSFRNQTTNENFFANIQGVDALHQGLEFEFAVIPHSDWKFDAAASFNDWQWENNVSTDIFDDNNNNVATVDLFIKDLKVGNAPQQQYSILGEYSGFRGLKLDAGWQFFDKHYADFDVTDRTSSADEGVQAYNLPSYGLVDAGASYLVPVSDIFDLRFRANVNNLLDNLYVAEATDITGGTNLANLRGYFGFGRTWNASAKVVFKEGKKEAKMPDVPMPAPAPVVLDRDGDGVLDAADDCPDTPGTVKGCPDGDGDGVIDGNDDCPDTPGVATNAGCPVEAETIIEKEIVPIPDMDGDGLLDNVDNCPEVAGPASNGGCPVVSTPAPVVSVPSTTVIESINFIAKNVYFNTNSAVLKSESKVRLDEIAAIVRQYPTTAFVIEGHTDSVGDAGLNMDLSRRRAASVVNYLITKGISSTMLSSTGYGENNPVATNDTAEGRAQNRRVVIRLR